MVRVKMAYMELMSKPLAEAARPIRPLVQTCREGHKEYGDAIADYSKVKSTYTDRLLPVGGMFANPAHGHEVYTDLVDIIAQRGAKSVLDLGCGGCDFLASLVAVGLEKNNLYGCSIHIGECVEAHRRGYTNVAPLDMRDIDIYYQPESFDCVVATWSLQHLTVKDRLEVVEKALGLLIPGGIFIGRDYHGQTETAVPIPTTAKVLFNRRIRFGNVVVLEVQ